MVMYPICSYRVHGCFSAFRYLVSPDNMDHVVQIMQHASSRVYEPMCGEDSSTHIRTFSSFFIDISIL